MKSRFLEFMRTDSISFWLMIVVVIVASALCVVWSVGHMLGLVGLIGLIIFLRDRAWREGCGRRE
jgi:hypothetical protein